MLNPDFRDMLSALSAEAAEFLVVGAYALAAHGHPRATGDIDLWINPAPENAARVWRALARFGSPLDDITTEDLSVPETVLQIGVAPRRIDLLTGIDGVDFIEAWQAREQIDLDGLNIPVISRSDLLRNKRATGRTQDRADAERLDNG